MCWYNFSRFFLSFPSFLSQQRLHDNAMPVYIVDSRLTRTRTGSDATTWIIFILLILSVILGLTLIFINALTRIYGEYRLILMDAYRNTEQRYRPCPYTLHGDSPNAETPFPA